MTNKFELKHVIKLPSGDFEVSFSTKDQVLEFIKEMKENIDKLESAILIFPEMIINYKNEYNSNILENGSCKTIFGFSDIMVENIKQISLLSDEEREKIYQDFNYYDKEE